ncbi:MAG: membrane protein insertase YidC [Gammaproteobacteria bacterium HGW-Gammaproteobacteria-3]|nr:MAG: membrane protein insertase YidC [Gammaproteobacteria bacterium HGW-Gammaproteobacteria-3]
MDNIRFILVVIFAMLLYMLWQAWQIDYGPKPTLAESEQPGISSKEDLPTTSGTQTIQNTDANVSVAEPNAPNQSSAVIIVKTDVLSLEIDTQGGTIRNLDLLKYPKEKENTVVQGLRKMVGLEPSEKDLTPIRLFDGSKEKLFLAQSGLIAASGSTRAADHHSVFQYEKSNYVMQKDQDVLVVPLTWSETPGLKVTKTFLFKRGSYQITLQQDVDNTTDKVWSGRQYNQLLRVPYSDQSGNNFIRTYAGGVVYTEENKYKKISYDDMADENLNIKTTGGWVAMIQHYFASAWIPPVDKENNFYTKALDNNHYVIGSYSPLVTIAPHTQAEFTANLFAGPKIQPMMEKIAKGLELTVDYSWLTVIGKPIYWLLNQIHDFVDNWGLAIIGVTLCIKLLFFKLSQASYQSMAKMRKIQPRLKELQERFADDRQRFNKEMMDMYKREKVNPLGGCLPIMVQIPVFISLYWVLVETVEIRQAPFALWVQDLSAQDPFYILPILMGITMKIQQSLNPAPIDPLQAKIMKMFPIVFTVFFLFFPAGLVLYWVVNNTLSIVQQWYITKGIDAAK